MSNIVLIAPSFTEPPVKLYSVKAYEPLPLLYVAAPLVHHGYTVTIIDQQYDGDWKNSLRKAIGKDTLCVGVTAITGMRILFGVEIARFIKENYANSYKF